MERDLNQQEPGDTRHQAELREDRRARVYRRERYGDIDSIESQLSTFDVQEEAAKIVRAAQTGREHPNF